CSARWYFCCPLPLSHSSARCCCGHFCLPLQHLTTASSFRARRSPGCTPSSTNSAPCWHCRHPRRLLSIRERILQSRRCRAQNILATAITHSCWDCRCSTPVTPGSLQAPLPPRCAREPCAAPCS